MNIQYKTEGRLELQDLKRSADTLVISWIKGDNKVLLLQGSSGKVVLSKQQLIDLAVKAECIADDIQPDMNSLPRPA